MPLNMVSMAIYVTLEGKIPRTPRCEAMKVLKSLDSIRVQYEAVVKAIAQLKVQQKALKKAGIDYGTPNYKEGKYLRIVRPATDERGRQFEYVCRFQKTTAPSDWM